MIRRTSAAAAVVALVALAGCGGFLGGLPGGSGDATPPATPNTSGVELPPGVNETGIADPDALLAAHRASLSDSGFVVSYHHRLTRRRGTVDNASPSVAIDTVGRVRAAPNLTAHRLRERRPGETTVAWYNGSVGARRVVGENDSVGYESYGTVPSSLSTHYVTERFLATDGWRLVEVREGGERFLLRLETTLDRPPQEATPLDNRTVTVSARMVVDATGRIRSLNGTIEDATRGTFEGDRYVDASVRRLEYEIVSAGNVSVAPPDWLDAARAAGALDDEDADA